MKPEYVPGTMVQHLGKVAEECGEVIAAVGKTLRWGLDSVNPELPKEEQETNEAWILREMADAEEAFALLRRKLRDIDPRDRD